MLRRAVNLGLLAGALVTGTGCYSYVPLIGAAPAGGAEVAVILTDRGRVALSDRVGPEVDQLRGVLMSSGDSALTLSMRESVSLRGVSAKWTDEVLTLNRDQFGSVRVRQFSRGRTSILAGSLTGAAVAFIVGSGIDIGGRGPETDPTKPPTGTPPITRVGSLTFLFRSDF